MCHTLTIISLGQVVAMAAQIMDKALTSQGHADADVVSAESLSRGQETTIYVYWSWRQIVICRCRAGAAERLGTTSPFKGMLCQS